MSCCCHHFSISHITAATSGSKKYIGSRRYKLQVFVSLFQILCFKILCFCTRQHATSALEFDLSMAPSTCFWGSTKRISTLLASETVQECTWKLKKLGLGRLSKTIQSVAELDHNLTVAEVVDCLDSLSVDAFVRGGNRWFHNVARHSDSDNSSADTQRLSKAKSTDSYTSGTLPCRISPPTVDDLRHGHGSTSTSVSGFTEEQQGGINGGLHDLVNGKTGFTHHQLSASHGSLHSPRKTEPACTTRPAVGRLRLDGMKSTSLDPQNSSSISCGEGLHTALGPPMKDLPAVPLGSVVSTSCQETRTDMMVHGLWGKDLETLPEVSASLAVSASLSGSRGNDLISNVSNLSIAERTLERISARYEVLEKNDLILIKSPGTSRCC